MYENFQPDLTPASREHTRMGCWDNFMTEISVNRDGSHSMTRSNQLGQLVVALYISIGSNCVQYVHDRSGGSDSFISACKCFLMPGSEGDATNEKTS